MHYYQFNIGDYSSHTSHLEPLEDLAYRRMLDWCYLNESPLPESVEEIGRLIRMRTHTDCIAVVLQDFFELVDGSYVQHRVQGDIDAYHEKSAKAKKSAEARWSKTPPKNGDSIDANALRTESDSNANHKPLTTNHKPITKNEEPKSTRTKFLMNSEWKPEPESWRGNCLMSGVDPNYSDSQIHEFRLYWNNGTAYFLENQWQGKFMGSLKRAPKSNQPVKQEYKPLTKEEYEEINHAIAERNG